MLSPGTSAASKTTQVTIRALTVRPRRSPPRTIPSRRLACRPDPRVSARVPASPGPPPRTWYFAIGSQMPPPAGDVDHHRDHQHDDHPQNDRDVDPASKGRRVGKRISQWHHGKEHRGVPRRHRRLEFSSVPRRLNRNEQAYAGKPDKNTEDDDA